MRILRSLGVRGGSRGFESPVMIDVSLDLWRLK